MDLERERRLSNYFMVATVISCVTQISWFASKCFAQIDFDGMSYVGIARHLSQGQFHAAINAFRSPLISWIIAVGSQLDGNLLRVGKFHEYWQLPRLRRFGLLADETVMAFEIGSRDCEFV